MTSRVLQHCTSQTFEQFGSLRYRPTGILSTTTQWLISSPGGTRAQLAYFHHYHDYKIGLIRIIIIFNLSTPILYLYTLQYTLWAYIYEQTLRSPNVV